MAVASDARDVAQVQVETWQTAYRGIIPDEYLDAVTTEAREKVWQGSIARKTPELWVAEIDSQVVGWTAFGPSRDPDAAPEVGEVEAIYVLPRYWATGTGRALWLVTRRRLIERAFSVATLWVLAENARAIRFYEAAGFAPDPLSERAVTRAGRTLGEIRYETTLSEQRNVIG